MPLNETNFYSRALFFRKLLIWLFAIISIWWLILQITEGYEHHILWSVSYQVVALVGALGGFMVKKYIFYEAPSLVLIRKSIFSFSMGLLFQVFGQSTFYFLWLVPKMQTSYIVFDLPGLFFLASLFCFIRALFMLAGITGIKIQRNSFLKNIEVLAIPVIILVFSYIILLKDYVFEWAYPLKIFFDFFIPIFGAIYVSLALIILIYSKNLVANRMKWPPILLAMIFLYVADFLFLYYVKADRWVNGGYDDFLRMVAYFVLSISLLQLGVTFQQMLEKDHTYE